MSGSQDSTSRSKPRDGEGWEVGVALFLELRDKEHVSNGNMTE